MGIFFGFLHLVWALAVAIVPDGLQSLLDWIFNIHFILPVYTIASFNWLNALILVVVTLVVGYILGWLFAFIHNLVVKKSNL